MPYLNRDEVESALDVATTAPFDTIAKKFDLPNLSAKDLYQTHLIKLGKGDAPGRTGIYWLGGVHAREWGSSDILINFIELVENAYHNGTGITIGAATYSTTDIKSIVDDLDIFIFPQCNPDGRKYSMDVDGDWRKNRQTKSPNSSSGNCVGVDINRNFDLLWDINTQWATPDTPNTSHDPCNKYTYNGPSAFSEPETLNAKWVHDNFANIRFFIDLHSYGEDILYSWGIDDNQSADPGQNFQNASYNSVRGILGDNAYREYIPSNEEAAAKDLANTFASGIKAVKGTNYLVEQSVGLYPTSGASDDYSYSRHYVDGNKANVTAFTLEWGPSGFFHPDYDTVMKDVIDDITSGLIAYCLWVRKSIEACSITLDRSTFGKDEVDAMLHIATPAYVEAAFYVVIDGFRAEELGVSAASLVGTPDVKPGIVFSPMPMDIHAEATACSTEGNVIVDGPQRFTWTYRMKFDTSNDFTMESQQITITASLPTTLGPTMTAQAIMTLTTQPNPYEIDGATSWLSVDLQVFNVLESGFLPQTSGVTLNAGPLKFIQDLLAAYNNPMLPRAPNHPFDVDLVANEDSSAVEISTNVAGTPVYNFAVARVRYRALSTSATNVRVFFRMFQASTTSTAYDSNTTYKIGGDAGTTIPLLGVVNGEVVTIPFFAQDRVNPNNPKGLNAQTDTKNIGPLGGSIPPDGSGNEVQVYFGCWLDMNQDVNTMPGGAATAAGPYVPSKSIKQLIAGKHQCLVAEINLDPPEPQISNGVSPSASDKLAQRNLNVIGVASPHLVPVTFDIKPTAAGRAKPDELMFDWRSLPKGTTATIFLPATNAEHIVSTANRLYAGHGLSVADANTLTCKAEGVTYIPIPAGVGSNYAGLMTLDVPDTVQRGEKFKAVARQITTAHGRTVKENLIEWRRIIGSFQVTVPVSTKQELLAPEQRLLSVMRWIAQSLSPASRWFPVMQRYLGQLATRVDALGGDATQIPPTPTGDWQAGLRCAMWMRGFAIVLGALLLSLGTLFGPVLDIIAGALILLLVILAVLWFTKCHPGFRQWMRALALGFGIGATLLVLALLFGIGNIDLLFFLGAAVLLMAIAYLAAR